MMREESVGFSCAVDPEDGEWLDDYIERITVFRDMLREQLFEDAMITIDYGYYDGDAAAFDVSATRLVDDGADEGPLTEQRPETAYTNCGSDYNR